MRKIFIFGAVGIFILLAVAVFATASEVSSEITDEVSAQIGAVAGDVQKYVGEFVEKRGINAGAITNVTEVNFDDLPKEVNIENVDDTNLAIYQVNYEEEEKENQIFVITYSTEELKSQGDLIIAHDKRQFLNFGSVGEMSEGFLKTASGVEGSLERGYVMIREGSITGISTNLEVVNESVGENIEIIVYKNGEAINFGNVIGGSEKGVKKDYDVQSNNVVTFQPGDIISAYATSGDVVFESVITMVEITTIN